MVINTVTAVRKKSKLTGAVPILVSTHLNREREILNITCYHTNFNVIMDLLQDVKNFGNTFHHGPENMVINGVKGFARSIKAMSRSIFIP